MREKIMGMVKDAMKSGDKVTLSALRLMQAAIKDKDIEVRIEGRNAISDEEILVLFQKMLKQRVESLKMYEDAGRVDLAAQEKAEIDIINIFMPKQLNDAEIETVLKTIISDVGANSMKDIGKIMPVLKGKYSGQLDMSKANTILKALLGG